MTHDESHRDLPSDELEQVLDRFEESWQAVLIQVWKSPLVQPSFPPMGPPQLRVLRIHNVTFATTGAQHQATFVPPLGNDPELLLGRTGKIGNPS